MILLQLSSGQGPDECARAVALAFKNLCQQAQKQGIELDIIESESGGVKDTYKSLLITLKGTGSEELGNDWQGHFQWVCPSPFRPGHKRKNWFFSGRVFCHQAHKHALNIQYKSCRASGAGGQHVNTTNSAVQAKELNSGIQVRVESQRSQHANKKLAELLILQKLHTLDTQKQSQDKTARHKQHTQVQRGDASKVFKGPAFKQ